jgi:hypothetical protein
MPKLTTVNDHRSQVEAAERRLAAARAGLEGLQAERSPSRSRWQTAAAGSRWRPWTWPRTQTGPSMSTGCAPCTPGW